MMIYKIIIFAMFFILMITIVTSENKENIIIDSDMTFEQALSGTKAPEEIIDSLILLDVEYYSFDNKLHKGQLVINKYVRDDITAIFQLMKDIKFPVNKVVPIVKYNWSDDASMSDNNTSAFCYRFVAGTERLSNHSFGRAIDINPYLNPVIYESGKISPDGAKYEPKKPGTFYEDHPIVKEFKKRGWRWGGDFKSFKDYHHFDKR